MTQPRVICPDCKREVAVTMGYLKIWPHNLRFGSGKRCQGSGKKVTRSQLATYLVLEQEKTG